MMLVLDSGSSKDTRVMADQLTPVAAETPTWVWNIWSSWSERNRGRIQWCRIPTVSNLEGRAILTNFNPIFWLDLTNVRDLFLPPFNYDTMGIPPYCTVQKQIIKGELGGGSMADWLSEQFSGPGFYSCGSQNIFWGNIEDAKVNLQQFWVQESGQQRLNDVVWTQLTLAASKLAS